METNDINPDFSDQNATDYTGNFRGSPELQLTLAQEISVSKSPSKVSEVDFCTNSVSVTESHSEREAASFFIFRANWDALSRSCFPSVTLKKKNTREMNMGGNKYELKIHTDS